MGTDDDVTTAGTGFDTKRFALAEHRLNTGHPTDALATLADADPDDVRTWALRAAAFSALGDHVRAQHTAEEGLRLDPHDLPLLRLLADAQLELGLRIKTEDTLRAAMASHPDADVLLVDLADLRIDEGRYDLARDLLERAVAAGALNPSGRLAREVLMAYNEGRSKRAMELAEELRAHEPDSPRPHALLGMLEARRGATVRSARHFVTAARADPSNEDLTTAAREARFHSHPLMLLRRPVEVVPLRFLLVVPALVTLYVAKNAGILAALACVGVVAAYAALAWAAPRLVADGDRP